jgi:hypothetical protein
MFCNDASESLPRNKLHHLREQRLACVHATSGSVKPESIAKPYHPLQIVDTPESSETILNTGLVGTQ